MSQKIDLKLKGYGKNSYPKVVDTEFTQLIQSVETESEVGFVTNEQFFDIYNDRFYELPIEGPFSHSELIRRSTEYVGVDNTSEEVELLLQEINDLRIQLLESQKSVLEITNPSEPENE
tara:strand:- start:1813 stop:2169 length:357 start_codon:yes stop_codon:yes gene_type:complete